MAILADYFTPPPDPTGGGGPPRPPQAVLDQEACFNTLATLRAVTADIMEARSRSGVVVFTAGQKAELRTAFNAALTAFKDAARALPSP